MGLLSSGQRGLHSELQDNQGYIERQCLKKLQQQNTQAQIKAEVGCAKATYGSGYEQIKNSGQMDICSMVSDNTKT